MKRFLSLILMFFLISSSFLFIGCVSEIEDVAGTYKLSEIYSEGKTYKVGYAFNDIVLTENSAVLVLNEDETFSATYTDLDFVSTVNGTWDKNENMVTFTSSNFESINLDFEIRKTKDLLLIVNENSTILLKKV